MSIEQIRTALVLGVRGCIDSDGWKVEGSGGRSRGDVPDVGGWERLRRPEGCLRRSERGLGLGGRREGGPRTEPWGTPEVSGKDWELWELRVMNRVQPELMRRGVSWYQCQKV